MGSGFLLKPKSFLLTSILFLYCFYVIFPVNSLVLAHTPNITEKLSSDEGNVGHEGGDSICVKDLKENILNVIASFGVEGIMGIKASLEDRVLIDYNSEHFFIPASNNKILTTVAAFLGLDMNSNIDTNSYIVTPDSTNKTSLCVHAVGDPTLPSEWLDDIVKSLQTKPEIHSVICDISTFKRYKGDDFPNNWGFSDLKYYYGALPTPFIIGQQVFNVTVKPGAKVYDEFLFTSDVELDDFCILCHSCYTSAEKNTFKWFFVPGDKCLYLTGALPIDIPEFSFPVSFQNPDSIMCNRLFLKIKEAGLIYDDKFSLSYSNKCRKYNNATLIHTHKSPKLIDIMHTTLLDSNNLMAEIFLRILGVTYPSKKTNITQEAGFNAVKQILKNNLGIDQTNSFFYQDDGCGLSRQNMVTPDTLVSLFLALDSLDDDLGQKYRNLLPVGGKSGTLKSRFIGTPLEGKVWAKTGTMNGISALSGYAAGLNFDKNISFSIIVDNYKKHTTPQIRKLIDDILVTIATSHVCESDSYCPDDCSGHGKCSSGICHCSPGWNGPSCSQKVSTKLVIFFFLSVALTFGSLVAFGMCVYTRQVNRYQTRLRNIVGGYNDGIDSDEDTSLLQDEH